MNYKIIKLNNGEEIIGEVTENEYSVVVNRPMVFVTATMSDPSGIPMDVTFMKDWLNHSDTKTVEIEKAKIIILADPGQKTIDHYNVEITKKESINDKLTNDFNQEMNKILDQFIEDALINDMTNYESANPFQEPSKKKKKKRKQHRDVDRVDEPQMIYLSMMIPPEMLMNMVTSGIIDPEAIKVMIDEVKKKNRFSGDEKIRKDFGNKYSDWNPDPSSDDYK